MGSLGKGVEDWVTRASDAPAGPVALSSQDTRSLGRVLLFARAACALSGMIGVLLALAVTPDLVAQYLSPDNQLNPPTATGVDFVRSLTALMAAGLLVVASNKRWAYLSIRTIVDANLDVWPWAVLAVGLAFLLAAIGFAVSAATDTPIAFLFMDPNSITEMPLYYGGLEYAGAVIMASIAGIAIFSSSLTSGPSARFLVLGGLLTLWLVCDDLYMLHENSWRIGLNEPIVFGIYGALVLVFAATNLRHLLASPFVLLIAAGVFFALGTALDTFGARHFPNGSESILELTGICFWSAYFLKCSRNALNLAHPVQAECDRDRPRRRAAAADS